MLSPYHFNPPCRRDLTPREREVLDYVLAGKPNKLTAYSLGISQRTVEVHRSRIFQKLGVRNAIELVTAIYTRSGPAAHLLTEPQAGGHADGHPPSSSARGNGAALQAAPISALVHRHPDERPHADVTAPRLTAWRRMP